LVTLAMPAVWSDRCLLHEPAGEIWVGVRTKGTEIPEGASGRIFPLPRPRKEDLPA